MQEPIGCGKLGDMVTPGWKIAVVIDDISRPTPVPVIFPQVLNELLSAGIQREGITIVPALGLHRGMEPDEILKRCGLDAFDGIRWENHDTDDPDKLANLGTTSRSTPVLFNKTVATADLIVSIGCIEPHIIASFGGGFKNLLPGVAGRASIANNHSLNCAPSTFNMVGQPIENNPMRMDLEEAGRMLKPAVFIVNAILDNRQRLVQIVAGDPILAHRAGVLVSANLYGVKIPAPADVVITDSHPMNSDLRQGVKALANTIRALKPGGVIITLVQAEEGVGVFGLANKKLPVGRKALQLLARSHERRRGALPMPGDVRRAGAAAHPGPRRHLVVRPEGRRQEDLGIRFPLGWFEDGPPNPDHKRPTLSEAVARFQGPEAELEIFRGKDAKDTSRMKVGDSTGIAVALNDVYPISGGGQ